jgi:hypothetical protein
MTLNKEARLCVSAVIEGEDWVTRCKSKVSNVTLTIRTTPNRTVSPRWVLSMYMTVLSYKSLKE